MDKVIKLSYKELNESIQDYVQKLSTDSKVDDILGDMDKIHQVGLRDEEVYFLHTLMGDVLPDDIHEKELIENIKKTLKTYLDK